MGCLGKRLAWTPLIWALANGAVAAEPADVAATGMPTAAAAATSVATMGGMIPAGTEVHLTLTAAVTTRSAKPKDLFPLTTATPIVVDGIERVPVGVPAIGQVIHAQKAGLSGKPGELILAVRKIEFGTQSIPMHKFEPLTGKSRLGMTAGLSFAISPLFGFIHGGQIDLPIGTEIIAYVLRDTELLPSAPTTTSEQATSNPSPDPLTPVQEHSP